jgi:hypothetical protein
VARLVERAPTRQVLALQFSANVFDGEGKLSSAVAELVLEALYGGGS